MEWESNYARALKRRAEIEAEQQRRRRRRDRWLDLVAIVLLAGLAWLLYLAVQRSHGAPAPRPRPPRITAASISGGWLMTWRGVEAPCALREGGRWWCWWGNPPEAWVGSWELAGDVLTVREWAAKDELLEQKGMKWSVKLTETKGKPGQLAGDDGDGLKTTWRREGK